ncbi:MAG TPA: hypothetical protein PLI53_10760 [Geobacteraceae bacterium]|nr:hypothetical protein [Geobacteraceae bacterium]
MTLEYAFKRCRVCGGDIKPDIVTCPYCGTCQQAEMRLGSTALMVVLAVLGFLVIIFFGILSAFAIPRFIGINTEAVAAFVQGNSCSCSSVSEVK